MTKRKFWLLGLAVAAISTVVIVGGCCSACAVRIVDAQSTLGISMNPGSGFSEDLVTLQGPGVFISAFVAKRGGDTDTTSVELEIDGRLVHSGTFAALRNFGLTETNAFGSAVFSSNSHDTISIGYPVPLAFQDSLILRANNAPTLSPDTGVMQITGIVVHGK